VESLWRRVNAVKVQIANDHHVADQPTWADVHYLLSLLPQLSSSELARRIQERAVEIRKAGNDSGNERDQQFIEGGISALEILADDIEDGTFPVSSSERWNPEPPTEPHRCPHCSRRMRSDFDPDVGMWYECENCDYREPISSGATVSSSERGNEQRYPRMTPEDHRRIQETLDSLPEYPTEEEAESYLQACGTSGKKVVNQFIERLLKERLEFKEEVERLRVLLSSSERRCGFCNKSQYEVSALIQAAVGYICNECIKTCSEIIQRALPSANATPERRCGECGRDHVAEMRRALTGIFDYTGNDIQAIKNTAYRAIPNTKCQSAIECVFPATGAARDLGLDTNFPLSETLRLMVEWMQHLHESHNCDCHGWEQRSFLIVAAQRYQSTIALTGVGEEKQRDIWGALNQRRAELIDVVRSRLLTGEETADLIALQRVAGLVRELVADHPFEVNDNSPAVKVRPTAAVPAGVEDGAVAWLLSQIKHRLQTVLDCENSMCTHCCEVLAGDLAPMIDRAIELCATPAPAESEEAEPLNGSEDSWMTL
jgi:hypothetical protein